MHYEISAYEIAVWFAQDLSDAATTGKLQLILNEKYKVDEKLGEMAKKRINEALA